jgi:acyl-CoA thioesterase-2
MKVTLTDRRQALTDLFAFEQIAQDRFRSPPHPTELARLYGGQVVAQALAACQRTVEGRHANSCHAYFVRAGDPALPIDFAVERDTDGRSFSARRVVARQGDRVILTMSASFQAAEEGPSHHLPMPIVRPPDEIEPESDAISSIADRLPARHRPFWLNDMGFDYRVVEKTDPFSYEPIPARRHVWLKLRHRIADEPAEHQRLFAYASDLYLMHTGLLPLGLGWADPKLQDASLDHAIWFHDDFRVDDWLLYALDSPAAGHARTLGRGLVFTQDGRLVATAAQEGLIRMPAGRQHRG